MCGNAWHGADERQVSCLAVCAAVLRDLRPTFDLLVVDIPFLVDIRWGFGVDRFPDF